MSVARVVCCFKCVCLNSERVGFVFDSLWVYLKIRWACACFRIFTVCAFSRSIHLFNVWLLFVFYFYSQFGVIRVRYTLYASFYVCVCEWDVDKWERERETFSLVVACWLRERMIVCKAETFSFRIQWWDRQITIYNTALIILVQLF